jgi:hypothetical protein
MKVLASERERTARREVRAVADALMGEVDAQAQTMARRIHIGIPELDAALEPLTMSSCRANVWLVCAMLTEAEDPSTAVAPGEALHYARELVHKGYAPNVLSRTYRIGHAVLWNVFLSRLSAAISDPAVLGAAIEEASEWTFRYVDALSEQMAAAYAAEHEQWSRSAAARRTEEVRALLEGRSTDADEASGRLRYELRRHHLAFVVTDGHEPPRDDAHELEEVARAVAKRAGARDLLSVTLSSGMLACWMGGVAAAPAAVPAELCVSGGRRVHLAFGEPDEGLEGFVRSHRQALDARRVSLLARRPFGITRYGDAALLSLLTNDLDQARQFVARELGDLAADTDAARRLTATLRVFFEEGSSFKRTSERLGVHGNTVAYRVRRAGEILGHEVTERQLEVRVALQLVDMLRRADEARLVAA